MANITQVLSDILHRTAKLAHDRLCDNGYEGQFPYVNIHGDRNLPLCIYQPRTNALATSLPLMSKLPITEVVEAVLDAMAMCGCQRQYDLDMRLWNMTQNRIRMEVPKPHLHGTPKWRELREIIG